MAATIVPGQRTWSMTRDEEGHRTYKLSYMVKCEITDGPANALAAAGLPRPGDVWLVDSDVDVWAWCRHDVSVTPMVDNEPNEYFTLEFTFSTKPINRDPNSNVENPTLEPPKISGGFNKYQEEATFDRFGKSVVNSSWEQIRGPQVEFDANRPTIHIEQNVLYLGIEVFAAMVDTVNTNYMWGLPPRTIKLNNVSWERAYYGRAIPYYKRSFDFEINYKGWDRYVLDEGTKVLNGHWSVVDHLWTLDNLGGNPPDPKNPSHFKAMTDKEGNNIRTILDGAGKPFAPIDLTFTTCSQCPTGTAGKWYFTDPIDNKLAVTLTYGSDCSWSGTSSGTTYTLSYDSDAKSWLLISSAGQAWSIARNKWKCLGPNTLIQDISLLYDDSKSLTLSAGNQPGYRFISKYAESNFFILGIPMVIR